MAITVAVRRRKWSLRFLAETVNGAGSGVVGSGLVRRMSTSPPSTETAFSWMTMPSGGQTGSGTP